MMTAIKYGLAAAVLAISTAVGITLLTQGGFGTTPDEPAPESPAASVSPEDEALISDWFEEANESDEYPCFFTPLRYEQIGHQTLVRIIFTQKPEGTCTSEYVDSEDTFVFFVSGGEIIDHP